MSTNFPTALDALTNPAATDVLTGHAAQHSNANDAIEALQAKVGVNSSAVATSLDYKVSALESSRELAANKGVAGGYASLDGAGKVPAAQLPSYVDDVLEYADLAAFPVTGEAGKIYVALDTNKTYRWSGSAYIEISQSPGSTDSVVEGSTNLYFTAARVRDVVLSGISMATNAAITAADSVLSAFGKLQAQITEHLENTSNPHGVTKAQLGLGSVDNTSDADKPVSIAQQSALNQKLSNTGGAIAANTSTAALTITQTGDGNALVIEDSTSPDSTPFVVDASGKLTVCTTTNTNSSTIVSGGTISETASGTQYLVVSQTDIGTAPNQIPLNQYLGAMAYQDKDNVAIGGGVVTAQLRRRAPVTKTASFTVADTEHWLICNGTASITVTLPDAALNVGREIMLKTIAAFSVISNASNVVQLAGGAAGTAILAATAGKYATLVSDGANWIIMQAN